MKLRPYAQIDHIKTSKVKECHLITKKPIPSNSIRQTIPNLKEKSTKDSLRYILSYTQTAEITPLISSHETVNVGSVS